MSDKLSRDDLIAELRTLASDLGDTPTRAQMDDVGEYSSQPYYNEFGGWTAALEAAGLTENGGTPQRDDLLDHYRDLAAELGHAPTMADMDEHGKYPSSRYVTTFGKWSTAREEAGFRPHPRSEKRIPEHELAWSLRVTANRLGRPPTQKEIKKYDTYSPSPYYTTFGSLADAFDAAGIAYVDHTRPTTGADYYGEGWQDTARRIRERDGYRCVVCGLTNTAHRKEYDQDLHVHHVDKPECIEEYDPNAVADVELVTLCNRCHSKWDRTPNDPRDRPSSE